MTRKRYSIHFSAAMRSPPISPKRRTWRFIVLGEGILLEGSPACSRVSSVPQVPSGASKSNARIVDRESKTGLGPAILKYMRLRVKCATLSHERGAEDAGLKPGATFKPWVQKNRTRRGIGGRGEGSRQRTPLQQFLIVKNSF